MRFFFHWNCTLGRSRIWIGQRWGGRDLVIFGLHFGWYTGR